MNPIPEPERNQTNQLLGVVLCGGKSSRMGTDKSQLPISAQMTYQRFACQRLQPFCQEVVCVGGNYTCAPFLTLPDPVEYLGPAIGVATAVQYADQHQMQACLITAVDLPDLQEQDLQRLIDQWLLNRQFPACAHDESKDRLQPLIAIYPTTLKDELKLLTQTSHRSLSRWLSSIQCSKVPFDEASLRNVNRPEDLT